MHPGMRYHFCPIPNSMGTYDFVIHEFALLFCLFFCGVRKTKAAEQSTAALHKRAIAELSCRRIVTWLRIILTKDTQPMHYHPLQHPEANSPLLQQFQRE